MSLPDLVLVHGGEHAGDCWDLVVAELRRQAPELRTLAVDLPGRGRTPGDLATATTGEWVDSVVAEIERERLGPSRRCDAHRSQRDTQRHHARLHRFPANLAIAVCDLRRAGSPDPSAPLTS
jgi:pimeloyl-ACP methyl ester carboxylesterase